MADRLADAWTTAKALMPSSSMLWPIGAVQATAERAGHMTEVM